MTRSLPVLALVLLAMPAGASSPSAWAAGDRAAVKACVAASGLRGGKTSSRVLFDDRVGKTAMLVTGVWPQKHMAGAKGTMLCLYDRRTRQAVASEAKGWRAL